MSASVRDQMQTITPRQLNERKQSGAALDLIDVRTPAEFREFRVPFARSEPLDRLDPKAIIEARGSSRDQPLYVICRSGARAAKACEQFAAAGFGQVVNVEGGTLGWEQAGLPLLRGKKTMSLERQTRIAAGSLVVIGTALGAFVNPWFLALSGFVGAGLVFAGVTDTCGMAMMLAKMPWNQASPESIACAR